MNIYTDRNIKLKKYIKERNCTCSFLVGLRRKVDKNQPIIEMQDRTDEVSSRSFGMVNVS